MVENEGREKTACVAEEPGPSQMYFEGPNL